MQTRQIIRRRVLVKIKMSKTALHGCVLDPCPERDFDPPLHSRSERREERVANPPQGRAHGTSRVFTAATRRALLSEMMTIWQREGDEHAARCTCRGCEWVLIYVETSSPNISCFIYRACNKWETHPHIKKRKMRPILST